VSGADFPAWYAASVFGGIGCAVLAALAIAAWARIRGRGHSRQLAPALLLCLVASALDSLLVIWMQERLGVYGPALGETEVGGALGLTALAGWVAPLGAMVWFVLSSTPQVQSVVLEAVAHSGRSAMPFAAPAPAPGRSRPALPDGAAWGHLAAHTARADAKPIYLTNEKIVIGRDPSADLTLPDELVSRFHAELFWENGRAWVKDLGSLNGTRLNRLSTSGKMALLDGDALQFGDVVFQFQAAVKDSATDVEQPAASPVEPALDIETRKTPGVPSVSGVFGSSAPPLALVWRAGTEASREWVLRGPLTTLGRDASCGVIIPDDSVSRLHAQVTRQPGGYYVVDVESANGVWLNGEQVTSPRRLRGGDIIRLGDAELAVQDVAASAANGDTALDTVTAARASVSGRKTCVTKPRSLSSLPTEEGAQGE
jgi:pSer/pThr/pTyr-binding forkhead associated (FHA) protein